MNTKIHTIVIAILSALIFNQPIEAHASDCSKNKKCIFVIGNSLTRHPPADNVNWHGDWGMAASNAGSDYLQQLVKLLNKKSDSDQWSAHDENGWAMENSPETYKIPDAFIQTAHKANLVIIELGDNYNGTNLEAFAKTYKDTAKALRPQNGRLTCISTWWPNPAKDKIIKESCLSAGGVFVDISDIPLTPTNIARNEQKLTNDGVAAHPGDTGMKAIAKRVFENLR